MKKLLIVLGLICVLIGATYGGVTLAAGYQTPSISPLAAGYQTPSISPLVMESFSGEFTVNSEYFFDLEFAQTRHVSLTILIDGVEAFDYVDIFTYNDDLYIAAYIDTLFQGAGQFHTYEFDTENIYIDIQNSSGNPIELAYYLTTTYPLW